MGAVRNLVDELRRRGVTVHEWAGWDGRGNADGGVGPRVTQIDPAGAVIHHTGSPYGSAYAGLVSSTRPELLGGCLCNFAGNEDGSLTVIASGLAWHAGAGVGPSLGRVLSKIPNIRNRMNRLTVGLEIVYPGNAPMRPEQYRTACVFASAVADLFGGGDLECVRAHAETNGAVPGGNYKWDPGYSNGKTIDMAAFRRDAAALATQEDDMTPDQAAALNEIRGFMQNVAPAVGQIAGRVADIHGKMTTRYDLDGRPGPDEDDLYGHILSARAAVEQAPAAGKVAVDAAAVGAALAADDKFMGALSARIADDIAARLQS